MEEYEDPICLVDGVFSIGLDRKAGTATFHDAEYYLSRTLDYWQFGALIKELEQIRRQLLTVDPWADPGMFTSGLD